MTAFKLVVVRCDGISHTSEFSGWSAETAMVRFRDEAIKDKRSIHVAVFSQYENIPGFTLYSRWNNDE